MSATLRDLPSLEDPSGALRDGTSRMTSRRVSPVLITPVPISVAPSASTTRPPTAPDSRLDAAVARLGPGIFRPGVEGGRTGISQNASGASARSCVRPDCRALPGAAVKEVLHRPRRPVSDGDAGV